FFQIGAGVVVGSGLAALMGLGSVRDVLILVGADGIMLVVRLAACVVRQKRALGVDPKEALRATG
ncbi:MAG TPA: hypothetical protein VGM50_20695, partial [Gemmatimonadaceae bacterium]